MEKSYPIPPRFRQACLLLVLLAVPMSLFIFGVAISPWRGWPSLGLLVVWLGMLAIPLVLLDFYHGEVVLSDEEVIVRRWRRERRLRYQEVTKTKQPLYNLPPEFSLWAGRRRVGIPTQIARFSEIYATLCEKVPVLRREVQAGFPYRLGFVGRNVSFYLFGLGLFLALWFGFSWGLVLLTSKAITLEVVRTALILFLMLGFFFAPATYITAAGLSSGSLGFRQPSGWEFTPDKIRFRYALGPWLSRPAKEMAGVELQAQPLTVRVSQATSRLSEQGMRYTLYLHFSTGFPARMEINLDRAIQFGTTLHQVDARLRHLYNLPQGKPGTVTAQTAPTSSFSTSRAALELRVDAAIIRNVKLAVAFFCAGGLSVWLLYFSFLFWPGEASGGRTMLICWPLGLFFWGLGLLAYVAYYFPRQPSQWIFDSEQIRFRYPWGGWQSRKVHDLRRIALCAKVETRFVPNTVGDHQAASVKVRLVELTFMDGRTLTISQDRSAQFGTTPEQVFAWLRGRYPQVAGTGDTR